MKAAEKITLFGSSSVFIREHRRETPRSFRIEQRLAKTLRTEFVPPILQVRFNEGGNLLGLGGNSQVDSNVL